MNAVQPRSRFIKGTWEQVFQQFVSCAHNDLLLVSPFIKRYSTSLILTDLRRRRIDREIRVSVLTNIHPDSILSGATDLQALADLKTLPRTELVHLPSLHAKVYVADEIMAIVTSANLTRSGTIGNLEYGIMLTERAAIQEIRADFNGYVLLGATITANDLTLIQHESEELKKAFERAERSMRIRARRVLQERIDALKVQLFKKRARGKTTQSILSDTILFLLGKRGLRTTELHPLIQQIHPDICDDSIDRVIDGVHFGKRWKHHVRSAQAFLKRKGEIVYDGEHWHLASIVDHSSRC